MSWNLEGKRIAADYLGVLTITGTVNNSRVAYGGKVRHYIVIDENINIGAITRQAGETLIVEESAVLEVLS